ncbi:hypothetical protein IGI04_033307 [Brassica rapa subsp. trilocularis]|uniref:Uncharacterized protein n=1 Tax=Brassica rapa subsp. trilocularis TaxID=1813537 RepID=A0ABQ7L6H5_BRACM|nr:hypothetical protein IGI04_033307 [Brassica rapa subsp. trilocularis]
MHFSLFLHCISLYQVLEFPLEILEASKAPERGTGATCDTRSRRIEGWRDVLHRGDTPAPSPTSCRRLSLCGATYGSDVTHPRRMQSDLWSDVINPRAFWRGEACVSERPMGAT